MCAEVTKGVTGLLQELRETGEAKISFSTFPSGQSGRDCRGTRKSKLTTRVMFLHRVIAGVSALDIHCSDQDLAGIRRDSMGSILEAVCRPSIEGTTPSCPLHQEGLQNERKTGCVGHMYAPGAKPATTAGTKEAATADTVTAPLYKIVKGQIPAMPPESFLMPKDRNRRRIHPTTIKDCDSDNTIARHEIRNFRGFKIPNSKTEQYNYNLYKNSFFVRTVADWNKLKDTVSVVTVDSVTAFSSALGRVLQGA